MAENAKIKVTGMSDDGNPFSEPEFTVTEACGRYDVLAGRHVVTFEETDPDTGMLLKTIIRFDEETAEVIRKGSIESKLVFDKNKKNETMYTTPYGSFQMATVTSRLELEKENKKIDLHVNYDLEINDEFVSKNSTVIEIEII